MASYDLGSLGRFSSAKKFIVAIDPAVPPSGLAGAVVAIGNFDGVHRGHLAVIKRARSLAEELNCPCAVLTFEPHPADFFRGPNTIFRLTPRDAKARALEQLGIDGMIVITFDKVLASLPAEAFIVEILVRRLNVRAVVAGYDFHFGAGRSGSPAVLEEQANGMALPSRSWRGFRRIRRTSTRPPPPRRPAPRSRQAT